MRKERFMKTSRLCSIVMLMMATTLSASCSRSSDVEATASQTGAAPLPAMIVHKSESCSCCEAWVTHVRLAGIPVEVRNEDNLSPVGKGSCHTAEIDGYLIEGHVPVADIKKLLKERPDARGLVLAGMPLGSPGMEASDGSANSFVVELVARDGSTTPFSEYPAKPGADAVSK
jgi:hypothetical protein